MAVEIDHRQLAETGLFVALPGTKHDGHAFLDELATSHCALVKTPSDTCQAAQLCVSNPLDALHDIASAAMAQTHAHKIAITGSVGKTSTKEALASLLSAYGICHASKGNYNNHIGAPLSMARTADEAEMIVMEMGMNHAGEISPLSHLYQADIAIITAIADSHRGHFASTEEIAHAKAEIFDGMASGIAILPHDDAHFALLAEKALAQGCDIISFGLTTEADIQLIEQEPSADGQRLQIANHLDGTMASFTFGLFAPHHSTTALIALAVLHALALDWRTALPQLAGVREVEGRGNQLALTIAGEKALLIDDSYNAGPASLSASLRYIASLPQARKALILTDMLELGSISDEAHEALIPLIEAVSPRRIILIGPAMGKIHPALSAAHNATHYAAHEDAIAALEEGLAGCDLILVKGSNGSGAPAIARALQSSYSPNNNHKGAQHVS